MDVSAIGARLVAAKGYIGAIAMAGAIYVGMAAFARVPKQLDAHMAQADALKQEQGETNKKLDVLICLQAKLDTPIRCVAK